VIAEDHPLRLEADTPQRLRDRIEADLTVCARINVSRLSIAVLQCAECLAPSSGSQLHDYLAAPVCLRPLGYDPMLNLLSTADLALALRLALHSGEQGVFNIPGRDTLPLSRAIALAGRTEVPLPGFLLSPLYRLGHLRNGSDFCYRLNACRFHFGNVLDGRRAAEKLAYRPETFIDWRLFAPSDSRRSSSFAMRRILRASSARSR
jgi:UDP-glucose 4-epimerase